MAMFGTVGAYGAVTASTVAALVGGKTANRLGITLYNEDPSTKVYFGFDANVTSANGSPIPAASNVTLDAGSPVTIYVVTGAGTASVRWVELGPRYTDGY